MATPVRTLSSSEVSTGDPTRESHYDNLRLDMLIALTETDYGVAGAKPSSPTLGQLWFDTDNDIYFLGYSGGGFGAIASVNVVVNAGGITLSSASDMKCGDGLVIPVGANKWVT